MEKLQFTAVVMFSLLTLQLSILLPYRVKKDKTLKLSRLYLSIGTSLLVLQFLLQYIYGFRSMGITQAVMVNLIFFVPCNALFNMTILNLQQQGRIKRQQVVVAMTATVATWALLAFATVTDGRALTTESPLLRRAEYIAGIIYGISQIYFAYHLFRNDKQLRKSLDSYYDFFSRKRLMWMRRVAVMMTLLAIGVPVLIFSDGVLLKIYSATIFLTICYMVTTFTFYCVSSDAQEVMLAAQAEDDEAEEKKDVPTLPDEDIAKMSCKVEQWVANGGYLRSGLTIQRVADELMIPRNQLSLWLKTTPWELFNTWMNHLRIEAAKKVLAENKDWTNDAVARQCGFASRNYFQKVFKNSTGMTPTQYVEHVRTTIGGEHVNSTKS